MIDEPIRLHRARQQLFAGPWPAISKSHFDPQRKEGKPQQYEMIDLHSHILPALDDGASDLETSISMAQLAAESGTRIMACTPHIFPGLWENDVSTIACAVEALQLALDASGVQLRLCMGADIHIFPGLRAALEEGSVPTLNRSRYFLLEVPRHIPVPRIESTVADIVEAGFVPILTHPERLDFLDSHYDMVGKLCAAGCLMQITAGSVLGHFGLRARDRSMQLLDEERVDIVASDTHNCTSRAPSLAAARDLIAQRIGAAEADVMVSSRPSAVLHDMALEPRDVLLKSPRIAGQLLGDIDGSAAVQPLRREGR